jgi:hypothetical protein
MQGSGGGGVQVGRRTGVNAHVFHPRNGIVRLSGGIPDDREDRTPERDDRAWSSSVRPSVTLAAGCPDRRSGGAAELLQEGCMEGRTRWA